MKIKKGFKLRTIMGNPVLVAEGASRINFNKLISFNETAEFLWRYAEQKADFTNEQLAEHLATEYDITPEDALNDVSALTASWIENGIVER